MSRGRQKVYLEGGPYSGGVIFLTGTRSMTIRVRSESGLDQVGYYQETRHVNTRLSAPIFTWVQT